MRFSGTIGHLKFSRRSSPSYIWVLGKGAWGRWRWSRRFVELWFVRINWLLGFFGQVLVFQATCYSCGADCQTNMKNVREYSRLTFLFGIPYVIWYFIGVPHFNEILIMSTVCEACGWRNNEAKPSGGFANEGIRLILSINTEEDLNREVIKVIHESSSSDQNSSLQRSNRWERFEAAVFFYLCLLCRAYPSEQSGFLWVSEVSLLDHGNIFHREEVMLVLKKSRDSNVDLFAPFTVTT